jgi:prepilin-type N-terminal cleavage/methylation domain-containing protein
MKNKMTNNTCNIRKINNLTRKSKGFSLLELMLVLILSSIILGSLIVSFRDFMRVHRRQERINLIENSLQISEISIKNHLFTLPGRNLATSNGSSYVIPMLPSAGTLFDGTKNVPIKLGIITPYKVNANDAFTIVYGDSDIPRLPLDSFTQVIGSTRIVRVPLPAHFSQNQSQPQLQTQTTNAKGDLGGVEGNEVDEPNQTNERVSSVPMIEMFTPGQLMLIVESPSATTVQEPTKPISATLVKLVSVIKTNVGTREYLQFTLNSCQNGGCGQLNNDSLVNNTSNLSGAILTPVKFASFYLEKDRFGNKFVRSDGGLILPNGNGFSVVGGTPTIIGETDSLSVTYNLKDGSSIPTPATPLVPWLSDIVSVDITINGKLAGVQGTENFSRNRKINVPIISRSLEN